MELKPHLLEPDVFFANAVFLVEGSSDESVIRAISDNFGGVNKKRRFISGSPENPTMELKPHLLEPDVFFANAVFLVEGSSDESVIRAISDNFGGVFDSYEITIVNCGGVKSMKPYIKLLKAYSIAYYGLADKEYDGESFVIKLDVDLETELQKIIPEIEETTEPKKIKLKAEDAYCYMTNLLKTKEGFEKLKKTAIWTSVKNAADKQGISPKIFDEKYN